MDYRFQLLSDLEADQTISMANTFSPRQPPKETCWMTLLLRLPGEVRNYIYEYIAEESVLFRQPYKDSFSVSLPYRSQVYNADPRIFNEYMSIAYTSALTIQTTVFDFDFSHVAAFLDNLSDDTIKTFGSEDNESKRRFIINLDVTDHCSSTPPRLSQWFARFADGSKGSGMKFEYGVDSLDTSLLAHKPFRSQLFAFVASQLPEAMRIDFTAEARWMEFESALVKPLFHTYVSRSRPPRVYSAFDQPSATALRSRTFESMNDRGWRRGSRLTNINISNRVHRESTICFFWTVNEPYHFM